MQLLNRLKSLNQKTEQLDLQQKEDHDKLHDAIGELMDEAAVKTRREVESLRKIYNSNLDKLIEECHNLELVNFTIFIFVFRSPSIVYISWGEKRNVTVWLFNWTSVIEPDEF